MRAGLAGVGVRRRESFRRTGFWVEALQGAEGVRGGHEGGVVMPALPGAAFVVVEAEAGLDFAVVVFDALAEFRPADQGAFRGLGG